MNADYELINNIKKSIPSFDTYIEDVWVDGIEYPLDQEVRNILFDKIDLNKDADNFEIYKRIDIVKELWVSLIKKSIITLRYFDKREPFFNNQEKYPIAYGVDDLNSYFKKYVDFESALYGGTRYYRDHVVHVFRVWLLGIRLLLNKENKLLEQISIDDKCQTNALEKLAMWTFIALTHDLGYPLEKANK